jgi:hypothetical protein
MAKVMAVVSGTAQDKVAGERDAIAGIEQLIAELKQQRVRHLTDNDPAKALQATQAVAANEQALALRRERLKAFQGHARKEAQAKAERERDAAIEAMLVPRFAKIEQLAVELEGAVKVLSANYSALVHAQRELDDTWPANVPRPRFWVGPFGLTDLRGRIEMAMQYAGAGALDRFAEFCNLERPDTIGEAARKQLARTVEELRAVELQLPAIDDDDDGPGPTASAPVRGFAALATAP